MEAALIIYLISLLGSLKEVLVISSIIFAIISLAIVLFHAREHGKLFLKWRSLVVGTAILMLGTSIVPNEKTSYMMAAGYFSQQVVQSEHAKKLSAAVLQKLDEVLEEK